jgi:hypothetical protein
MRERIRLSAMHTLLQSLPIPYSQHRARAIKARNRCKAFHCTDLIMDVCSLLLITATASLAVRVLWLLYFHPLAKIPGPWILSTSYLPQLYYDGYHSSRMYKKICEWHEAYGTVVNPDKAYPNSRV